METTNSAELRERKQKKVRPTKDELRISGISLKFEGRSDRSLIEEQVHLSRLQNQYLESIKNNVQFFFWIIIASAALWLLIIFIEQ